MKIINDGYIKSNQIKLEVKFVTVPSTEPDRVLVGTWKPLKLRWFQVKLLR